MAADISVKDCARETYMGRTSTSARTRGSGVCRNPRLSSPEAVVEERDEHARERERARWVTRADNSVHQCSSYIEGLIWCTFPKKILLS